MVLFGTNKKTQGFTLIELIVTLVIIAILLSASAAGIAVWQKNSVYKRNNEYAQSLFLAAQSALSLKMAGNGLDSLEDLVRNTAAGSGAGAVSAESLPDGINRNRSLYYLELTRSQADNEETLKQSELYNLVKNYIYDKKVYNAAIRIEFDPSDGTVYSVCYSDRVERFDYSEADGSDAQVMGINQSVRIDEEIRRKRVIGYYESDMSDEMPPANYGSPGISRVILDNEEALVLRFSLAKANRVFWKTYTYYVELYEENAEGGADRAKAAFAVKGEQLADPFAFSGRTHRAEVEVTFFAQDGSASLKRTMPVGLKLNRDGEICIILDGIDENAAQLLDRILASVPQNRKLTPGDLDGFSDTYSFVRFTDAVKENADGGYGIKADAAQIFARVAVGTGSYRSRTASSNSEHPFMKEAAAASGTTVYGISRARHLYNIRFTELAADMGEHTRQPVRYEQKADIVWSGVNGPAAQYCFFDTQNLDSKLSAALEPLDSYRIPDSAVNSPGNNRDCVPFPAIPYLSAGHDYTGQKFMGNYSIDMLTLRETKAAQPADEVQVRACALGVFRINYGSIRYIDFTDVRVDGQNYTGTVCGLNAGTLLDISVSKGAYLGEAERNRVSGKFFVGGISGSDMIPDSGDISDKKILKNVGRDNPGALKWSVNLTADYRGLRNESNVSGTAYIGGILGVSCIGASSDTAASGLGKAIRECANTGVISTLYDGRAAFTGYVGGITGCKFGGIIRDCTSSMGSETIADLPQPGAFISDDLFCGSYMGGICGYLAGDSDISKCLVQSGVIQGRDYVGGIAGARYIDESSRSLDGTGSGNKAVIIGKSYVGGIIGVNAVIDDHGEPADTLHAGDAMALTNWLNEGVAIAAVACGGGITGYNAGKLVDCTVSADLDAVSGEQALARIRKWKHIDSVGKAGGLVGYNCGEIRASRTMEIKVLVTGSSYVGGLIGYNAGNSIVDLSKYKVRAAYVQGLDFVGGLIGLNTSSGIFGIMPSETDCLEVNLDLVKGLWFVGGVIGGNLIAPADGGSLYLQCLVDNRTGIVMSKAEFFNTLTSGGYAGGFIGYHKTAPEGTTQEELEQEAERLVTATGLSLPGTGNVVNPKNRDVVVTRPKVGEILLSIENGTESEPILPSAGGDGAAQLTVLDASAAAAGGENPGTGTKVSNLELVTGGICVGGILGGNAPGSKIKISYVTNLSRIAADECVDTTKRTALKASGDTYMPAKMEYDAATGQVTSIDGEAVKYSYLGGIIGRMAEGALVESCFNAGEVDSEGGAVYKGGITELNQGIIKNCITNRFGSPDGAYIGGITGRNEGSIFGCQVRNEITGRAAAGGIASENYQTIRGTKQEGGEPDIADGKAQITAPVRAAGTGAGGVAGVNAGEISGYILKTSIECQASYVGGITGINYGTIRDVAMDDSRILKISGKSYVGGFAGYMENVTPQRLVLGGSTDGNVISYSASNAEVTAAGVTQNGIPLGYAGGIIGYVADSQSPVVVQYCSALGKVRASLGDAGGITGYNGRNAVIYSCRAQTDVQAPNGTCGGIAGVNADTAQITGSIAGKSGKTHTIVSNSCMGGIAGENAGVILSSAALSLEIENIPAADGGAWIGGIAGINRGTIGREDGYGCWVGSAAGSGTSGSDSSGGVSRTDTVTLNPRSKNCYVGGIAGENRGTVYGLGGTDSPRRNVSVQLGSRSLVGFYGGAAGWNRLGAAIYKVNSLAVVEGIGNASGGLGGIAGQNDGTVKECDFSGSVYGTGTDAEPVHAGGIAGNNTAGGSIEKCTLGSDNRASVSLAAARPGNSSDAAGNVGGIAGMNTGRISQINWEQSASAGYGITITGARGNTGGITGLHKESAAIERCKTYGNWMVTSITGRDTASDDGVGGIIGSCISDKDVTNLINYAAVERSTGRQDGMGNKAAGGIIGRMESIAGTVTVSECINYGNVTGSVDCAGGIVGYIHRAKPGGSLQILDCRNEGNLYGYRIAGGILGLTSSTGAGEYTVRLIQCINTADIQCGDTDGVGAGIYAAHLADGTVNPSCRAIRAELISCRNYGVQSGNKGRFGGIMGIYSDHDGALDAPVITMKNCFGVKGNTAAALTLTDVLTPVSSNNYYFTKDELRSETYMEASVSETPGTENPEYAVDFNPDTHVTLYKGQNLDIAFKSNGAEQAITPEFIKMALEDREDSYPLEIWVSEDGVSYTLLTSVSFKSIKGVDHWNLANKSNDCPSEALTLSGPIKSVRIRLSDTAKVDHVRVLDVYADQITYPETIRPLQIKAEGGGYNAYYINGGSAYIKGLSADPTDAGIAGKTLFTRIDTQLKQAGWRTGKLASPDGLKWNGGSNPGRLGWNAVNGAFRYTVTIDIYDDPEGRQPSEGLGYTVSLPLGTAADIPLHAAWGGRYMRARVQAVSAYDGTPQGENSDWAVYPSLIKVIPPLPQPDAHLEFCIDEDGSWYYTFCLDNVKDYTALAGLKASLYFRYVNRVTNAVTERRIPIDEQHFDPISGKGTGNGTNRIGSGEEIVPGQKDSFSFLAVSDDSRYVDSTSVSATCCITTESELASVDIAPVLKGGFTGTVQEELGYSLVLKAQDGSGLGAAPYGIRRTDVLLYDKALNTYVAAGSVLTEAGTTEAQCVVRDLPQDLVQDFLREEIGQEHEMRVRSYLWGLAPSFLYYGSNHPVNRQPETGQEILNAHPDIITVTDGETKIRNGYFIERCGENDEKQPLYQIWYSAILADRSINGKYGRQYREEVIDRSRKQPRAELNEQLLFEERDGQSWCTFRWSDSLTEPCSYQVKVQGIRPDKTAVPLYSGTVNHEKQLKLPADGWEYSNIEIEVTTAGTLNEAGYIDKLCSYSRKEYAVKAALPQIMAPSCSRPELGLDDLFYDVKWAGYGADLPDIRKELKSYDLYAALDTAIDEEVYQRIEAAGYRFDRSWDKETESFLVLLQSNEWYEDPDSGRSIDTKAEGINMDCFQGLNLQLYVKAVAVEDAQIYKDSEDGVHTGLAIDRRIELPETDCTLKYTSGDEFDGEKVLSIADFMKMDLTVNVTGRSTAKGSYRFEAAVYDGMMYTDGKEIAVVTTDSSGQLSVNKEAVDQRSQSLKADPMLSYRGNSDTGTGSLAQSQFRLAADESGMDGWMKIYPGDLAGKYLIIRYRAVENRQISSHWSEYMVFQLPLVRLDTVELIAEERIPTGEPGYTRTVFSWTRMEYSAAGKYVLSFHNLREPQNEAAALEIGFSQEGGPTVSRKAGPDGHAPLELVQEVISDNSTRYLLKEPLKGYGFTVEKPDGKQINSYLNLDIIWERTEFGNLYVFNLWLPDIGEYQADSSRYLYTSRITLTAEPKEAGSIRSSDPSCFIRTIKGSDEKTLGTYSFRWEDGSLKPEDYVRMADPDRSVYSPGADKELPIIIRNSNADGNTKAPGGTISGNSVSGNGISGNDTPGNSVSGNEKPGNGKPGNDETGSDESGSGESGSGESGSGESGSGESGSGESGGGESGSGESGGGESGSGESGSGESGGGESGSGESGSRESGGGESGSGEPGSGESEIDEFGSNESGNHVPGTSSSVNPATSSHVPGTSLSGNPKSGSQKSENHRPESRGSVSLNTEGKRMQKTEPIP